MGQEGSLEEVQLGSASAVRVRTPQRGWGRHVKHNKWFAQRRAGHAGGARTEAGLLGRQAASSRSQPLRPAVRTQCVVRGHDQKDSGVES